MNLKEGEVLEIHREDHGWIFGQNNSGQLGNFPINYIEYVLEPVEIPHGAIIIQ